MEIFDPALDDVPITVDGQPTTVAALVAGLRARIPSDASLDAATVAFDSASPAMLDTHARWLDLLPSLRAALPPERLLQVCARSLDGAYGGRDISPSVELFDRLLDDAGAAGLPWATAVCDAALGGTLPQTLSMIAATAAARLLPDRSADTLLPLVDFYTSPEAKRAILAAASPEPRARWLQDFLAVARFAARPDGGQFVGNRVERVLPLLDLFGDAPSRASLEEALAAAGDHPAVAAARAELAAGPSRTPVDRRAVNAASADYVRAQSRQRRRILEVATVVQRAATRAISVDDAAELDDADAWLAAPEPRRRAIVERVARALGDSFELQGIETFDGDDLPIAVFRHEGARFHLIPGGTFDMGFSPSEEAAFRPAAARAEAEGIDNWYEEYGALLDNLASMRPLPAVRVRPLLVAQAPTGVTSIATLADSIEAGRFRLLSEAEREYLARGGIASWLTPLGNEPVGDEALAALEEPTGAFGLVALGLYPELCADSWHDGYEGAPTDGTPRPGGLPLVVRGGASWVHPWQACGEWQLLLCAVRSTSSGWSDQAAARWALGIDVR